MDLTQNLEQLAGLTVYPRSVVKLDGNTYFLTRSDAVVRGNGDAGKRLGVLGDATGFEGSRHGQRGALHCPLTPANGTALRTCLPWLHIADCVGAEAIRLGYKQLGLMGTRYLMEGPVYPDKLGARGIEFMIPKEEEREQISDIIFDELVHGLLTITARDYLSSVISRLERRGCDAVVLGCTELPLIVQQEDSRLPILDSTRILARAALRKAV